jgi:transposase
MWDNELSYGRTAVHFDIRSAGSVGVWERQYREGGLAQLVPKPRGRSKMSRTATIAKPKKDEDKTREELIAELNRLRMEVEFGKKLDALVQAKKDAAPAKKRGSSSN